MTGITTDGNIVARLDRKLLGRENIRQRIFRPCTMKFVLILFSKTLQMAVNAGEAIGMGDIDGIAEAVQIDRQPADIAISNGKDILALHIARLNIQTTMKVKWAGFTEVARQRNIVVYGGCIGYWLLTISRWLTIATRHQ